MSTERLDAARKLVEEDLHAVDGLMAACLTSRAEIIEKASQHLLLSGGKRIRALLCLLAGRATAADFQSARVVACAAELIHAASLCHDDVLDRGTLRRGRPTVRVLFGDALSILLGDFCLTRAFRLMAEHGLAEASVELGDAVVDMAEGEVVQAQQLSETRVSVEDYLKVAAAKTGSLLTWCTTLGGIVPEPYRGGLRSYGFALGRVYQIADDLLDFEMHERSGKRESQDLLAGEWTLPLLLACEKRPELQQRLAVIRTEETPKREQVQALVADIRATGALGRARQIATAEAEKAGRFFASFPPSPALQALGDLAIFAADRHV